MKQLTLDIGLAAGPSLQSFFPGPNREVYEHLLLWVSHASRSPVPTYLWGDSGSGKTHLLKAVHQALREQGATVGWLDAGQAFGQGRSLPLGLRDLLDQGVELRLLGHLEDAGPLVLDERRGDRAVGQHLDDGFAGDAGLRR